jgi:hypothetical protein
MAVAEPPICVPCVRLASRLCPALRKDAAGVRVRQASIAGVRGLLHRSGGSTPVPMDEMEVGLLAYASSFLKCTFHEASMSK